MVQRDLEIVVVQAPEFLERHLGLGPGVDEDQRRAGLADRRVDLGKGEARHVTGPGHVRLGGEHADLRAGAGTGVDPLDRLAQAEPAGERVRVRHGGREADAPRAGRQTRQPGQAQGQQLSPLAAGQRVQLVDHHVLEPAEQGSAIAIAEEQRQLLRRRQQDVGRAGALAAPAVLRGIAGAGLDPDRQAGFLHRRSQVALDVDGERLQRRDVERGELGRAVGRGVGQPDQSGDEAGQGLAPSGRRLQQDVAGSVPPRRGLAVGARAAAIPGPGTSLGSGPVGSYRSWSPSKASY